VLTPQGRVAGIVAEGDLLRKEQLQRDPEGRHSMHLPYRIRRDIATAETAGELMDRYPATVPGGTSVAEAARLMDRHQSRFLLVTGEDGKLLGVVTARDLLRVFLRPDAAIKAEISRDVLARYLSTNSALVDVDVTDGVVRLTGELERKSMLAAALRAVRAVDGVIDVESQLGYAIDDIRPPLGPDLPVTRVIPPQDLRPCEAPSFRCVLLLPRRIPVRRGETVTVPRTGRRAPRNRNPREAEAGSFSVL
jgi:CBS domain-containing protein